LKMDEYLKTADKVISVLISGIGFHWSGARDCTVLLQDMEIIYKKSLQLKKLLKHSGLLKKFSTSNRFVESGIMIDVLVDDYNRNLSTFENKLEKIREELKHRFVDFRDNFQPIPNPTNTHQSKKSKYIEYEAIQKFLSISHSLEIIIDFYEAGKEVFVFKKIKQKELYFLDKEDLREVTGEISHFDNGHQRITLYNLHNLTGSLTLQVIEPPDKMEFLRALAKNSLVSVKFLPLKNILRPDKKVRKGRLIEIVSIGSSKEILL